MVRNAFDRYLSDQMTSASFAKAYAAARTEIDTIDQLVRALDARREAKGLTKAQLARSVGMEPAALRRLFTSDDPNPTFSTIATLLSRLDLGLVVVPKTTSARRKQEPRGTAVRAQARKSARRAAGR